MASRADGSERRTLQALLAALEDPARARELSAGDAAGVLTVARHHRLSPLLSARCRDTLPGPLGEACRRDRAITTARNLLLGEAAEEALLALAARGIEGVLLKGLAYDGRLYDEPGSRPTGDVDILVHERNRRAAFQVLSELGYEPKAAAPGFDDATYHEVAWTRGPIAIDLHMALAPLVRCGIDYAAVWSELQPAVLGHARTFVLAPAHAAVFHALHMAIDHFDVPALYLVDLGRLLPNAAATDAADGIARSWRCRRPLVTSLALAGAFLPRWARGQPLPPAGRAGRRVVAGFGSTAAVARDEQIFRKFAHFDSATDALRYLAVQASRNAREQFERRVRKRSARARLGL
jgi:hypothetical protein